MYTQQDVRKIVVVVKGEGMTLAKGTEEKAPEKLSENVDEDVVTKDGGMSKRTRRIIVTNATHFVAVSKQISGLAMNYALSRVSTRNGDQALQDNFERKVEIYKDSTGLASSVAMGMVYGSWGGPVGAAVGSFMGAASFVASTSVKYLERNVKYQTKLFKENNSIAYQRARANLSATTGRLR